MKFETVIGLEIHIQLKTKSKLFCRCANVSDNAPPNSAVCEICMGHPGTLPVPNDEAIAWAVKTALALRCAVALESKFDRKSYFYPDLPKGYQISQYDQPLGKGGKLEFLFKGKPAEIDLERLHLEEDSGKLIHPEEGDYTLVDYNRAGTPLMEIVTTPSISDPELAKAFLQELRLLVRYLGVSDADMEKGQLRCDANISLRPESKYKNFEAGRLYPKTEVKNINSFRAVEKALKYEEAKQSKMWEQGKPPAGQSTHGWDDKKGVTIEQRTKEEVSDYRFFPEPDIPPLSFTAEGLKKLEAETPELPVARRARFIEVMGFTEADSKQLVDNKQLAEYTEKVISELHEWVKAEKPKEHRVSWIQYRGVFAKLVANWLINVYAGILKKNKRTFADCKTTPENFAELLAYLYDKDISKSVAKNVLEEMEATGQDPSNIIDEKKLWSQAGNIDLEKVVAEVIKNNPKAVADYNEGKKTAAQFLVGQVMKETKGTADAQEALDMIVHKLG
ncbi:MAG: Asp-tRNA(Asn)/Glu-tRNA(Gln) amidotransferase subunit GatB [Patescibacteria group bacterium]